MSTKNKLYKSSQDKALFGVCGGIAEYFDIDSLVVRLAVVLFSLAFGSGVLFYIIAALVIPSEPEVLPDRRYASSSAAPAEPVIHVTPAEEAADGEDGGDEEGDAQQNPPESVAPIQAKATGGNPNQSQLLSGVERVKGMHGGKPGGTAKTLGFALVVLGVLILIRVFFPWINSRALAGICLVAAGLYFIFKKS